MELARLSTPLADFDRVQRVLEARSGTVVVRCTDAPTVVAVAARADTWSTPVGVWLEVTPDYRAALGARDVATLSWLLELTDVVVSAASKAPAHASVLEALLSDDEVNVNSEVAVLRHAYNRPAPPRAITVWSWDGVALRRGRKAWVEHTTVETDAGALTTFAPTPAR